MRVLGIFVMLVLLREKLCQILCQGSYLPPHLMQAINFVAYYSQGFASDWPYTSYYGENADCNLTTVKNAYKAGRV